jgi:ATP-dependent RNA helicase DDX19/DBP5
MASKVDWAACAEEQQKMLASELKNLKVEGGSGGDVVASGGGSSAGADQEDKPDEAISSAEVSLLQKVIRTGLITSKHDIEVQRKDPNSPLYSVKSFEALKLRPELLKGLYAMGFDAPSKIQETALPTLLADP